VPAQEQGRFTGAVRGLPCFREGKVQRVASWLESMGLHWNSFEQSTFYSDSRNDLALLEQVSEPVAVNPDATLRGIAQERGWRILHLFQSTP
jgi:phosphoserine phosphatase